MILGIMQPYFFPYLGYFDLMNYADEWIVFDTAQYIRHGWVNRNRILHPQQGWQYVTVPLHKHSRETPIGAILSDPSPDWRSRIIGQLGHYKKRAGKRYEQTVSLVEQCLAFPDTRLSKLNVYALAEIARLLGIEWRHHVYSEMHLDTGTINHPGDWAFEISRALGATEYVNPPGGEALFDQRKFEEAGIKLTIRHFPPMVYDCPGYTF